MKPVDVRFEELAAFLLCILFILSGCGGKKRGGDAGSFPDGDYEIVSIFAVLASPDQYSERHIEVTGFLASTTVGWLLFPTTEYAMMADFGSVIGLNMQFDGQPECDQAWVVVKGVTQPYIGLHVEFNPEKIHYVSLVHKQFECYATEEFKNSSGRLFILEEGDEITSPEESAAPEGFR